MFGRAFPVTYHIMKKKERKIYDVYLSSSLWGGYTSPHIDVFQINSDESFLDFSTITIDDGSEVDWGEI